MGQGSSKDSSASDSGVINNEFKIQEPADPMGHHVAPLLYAITAGLAAFAALRFWQYRKKKTREQIAKSILSLHATQLPPQATYGHQPPPVPLMQLPPPAALGYTAALPPQPAYLQPMMPMQQV